LIKCAVLKNSNKDKSAYIETLQIPQFYMEDFTVLGITVEDLRGSQKLLLEGGYLIKKRGPGFDVLLKKYADIRSVIKLLDENGIHSNYTDIADIFYQA